YNKPMTEDSQLELLRTKIDEVDSGLLILLKQRSNLVAQVTTVKKEHSLSAHQPERFESMMNKLHLQAESLSVNSELVDVIWNAIHLSSQKEQNKTLL